MNGQTQKFDSPLGNSFGDFVQSLDTVATPPRDVSQDEDISPEDLDALLLAGANPLGDSARNITASIIHNEIKICYGCEATLRLPALKVGERPETWRCTQCGAVFLTGCTVEKVSSIQNAEQAFRESTVPVDKLPSHQTENFEALIKSIAGAKYVRSDRRVSPRYPISLPAIGMPLNAKYQSTHSAVDITLRDISFEGLSFFSELELNHPYLLVDITPGGFIGAQVVLKICRTRPLGLMHEVAGTFV